MMEILKKNINKKYIILLLIVNFLIIGLYYTYAIFVTKQLQENVAVLITDTNGIDVSSPVLTNQTVNLAQGETLNLTITLKNNTSTELYYRLLHEKVPTGVMIYETNNDNSSQGTILGQANKEVLVTIVNNTVDNVTVKFYCQANDKVITDKEMGYSYINKTPNFDHTGANEPRLDDMKAIPVYYEADSTTTGNWKKADKGNKNKDAIWYDYDNGRWANIVLVREEKREYYLNAPIGTIIDENDILTYFVWIPSFRYKIVNANNTTNYERDIDVLFETNKDKLGTVQCQDSLSSLGNEHLYSEICYDEIYGRLYDNLSTYSHPAFKNSIGFWIGKFQTSSNGEKMIPNALAFETTIDKAFTFSRSYEVGNNPYGIITDGTNSVRADGIILNDTNALDSHLLTNMEWGAVAILANSLYGKSGNSNYYNEDNYTFKRIYLNANDINYTGCSTNYTNSSNSFVTAKTANCIRYNDLTSYTHVANSITYPIGPVGPGASTTGTVYGVYDMAGGTQEMVASFGLDNNHDIPIKWNSRYYDAYSFDDYVGSINDSGNINHLYRYKLGDGIREHYRSFNDNGMWYSGSLNQSSKTGYLIRGGNFNSGRGASIFTSDMVPLTEKSAYRVVISY